MSAERWNCWEWARDKPPKCKTRFFDATLSHSLQKGAPLQKDPDLETQTLWQGQTRPNYSVSLSHMQVFCRKANGPGQYPLSPGMKTLL